MTKGKFRPSGKGSGSRSGGTGERPTLPPRLPFSLKRVFGGTVISTPARAGLVANNDAANDIFVGWLALTDVSASAAINGRKIAPVPPARLLVLPGTVSQALPTKG